MEFPTILIIDDAADHRDILSRWLRSTGYRVVESEPGPDAISHAEQASPDLIMVNLSLPGQPGWETARQLRMHSPLSQTPMLGTSVFTDLLSRGRIRSIGCSNYVDKPFDLDLVLTHVRDLIPMSA
jgi:CheY-like chemotaxis protein